MNLEKVQDLFCPVFFGIQDDMLMLFCVAVYLFGDYVFMLLSAFLVVKAVCFV
jgi:hypothetical protein